MNYLRRYTDWSMSVVEARIPKEERVKLAAFVLAWSGLVMFLGIVSLAKAVFDFYFWKYDLQYLGAFGIAADLGMLLTGVYCCTWSMVLYRVGLTCLQRLGISQQP